MRQAVPRRAGLEAVLCGVLVAVTACRGRTATLDARRWRGRCASACSSSMFPGCAVLSRTGDIVSSDAGGDVELSCGKEHVSLSSSGQRLLSARKLPAFPPARASPIEIALRAVLDPTRFDCVRR